MLTPIERKWSEWMKMLGPLDVINIEPQPLPSNDGGMPEVMVEGLQSPDSPGRSIVLLELKDNDSVEKFADAFLPRSQSSDLHGNVALLRSGIFSSYDVAGDVYFIGNISWYEAMRIWMTQYYWLLLIVAILASMLLAGWFLDSLERLAEARLRLEEDAD